MTDEIVVNVNFNLGKDQTVADIVTLLRKYQPYNKLHGQAADEIERLRAALALAVGELSTYGPMRYTSPEQLMQHFLQEARRD